MPRLVKIIFFNYLAKILCVELTSTAKRKQQKRLEREEEAVASMSLISSFNGNKPNPPPPPLPSKPAPSRSNRHHHHHHHHRSHHRHHRSHQAWSPLFAHSPSYFEVNRTDSPLYSSILPTYSNPNIQKLLLKPSQETGGYEHSLRHESLLLGQSSRGQTSRDRLSKRDFDNDDDDVARNTSGSSRRGGHRQSQDEVMLEELDRVLSKQFGPLVDVLSKTIESSEKRLKERRSNEIIQDEWSDVAMISDHMLCYFFCLLTIASCILIFFNSPHVLAEW